jgi:hypothetical protein
MLGAVLGAARSRRPGSFKLAVVTVAAALTGSLAVATPAAAAPAAAAPAAAPGQGAALTQNAPGTNAPLAASQRPPALTPLSAVDPGADGSVRPPTTQSPALANISPLPAIDPGPDDAPDVPTAVVPQQLPVTPTPMTLDTQPGQGLVDGAKNDALGTLANAGPYVTGGKPDIDANKLQPQVASAQVGDPAKLANLADLLNSLLSGNLPPNLPVDPLALLQQLPNGIPQVTYRVCSESATKPVSCTSTLPLGVPALVNVTGNGTPASPDRTPDVLADLVPATSPDGIVSASHKLLSDQGALAAATQSLTDLTKLLLDPLYLLTHPNALLQKLNLQRLIASLTDQVAADRQVLLSMVNVGLGFLTVRSGTSEIPASQPIKAHVWAVYDIPGLHRLSVGYDGYRRGAGLSASTLGIFTFNPAEIAQGIFDVHAEMYNGNNGVGGSALAITAGISAIKNDSTGAAYDPTVASARFSPVPLQFTAHAVIDPSVEADSVETAVSNPTQLDALVFSNHRPATSPSSDQYLQVKIDKVPNTVSATLHRPTSGGSADITYRASDPIDDVLFANYQYSGPVLQHAIQATAHAVPATIDLGFDNAGDNTTLTYKADSSLQSLGLGFYDASTPLLGTNGQLVARGGLTDLPKTVTGTLDSAAKHLTITADQALGSIFLQGSYRLGEYAPLPNDHATLILAGKAFGLDARISGVKSVDAWYDEHPRITTTFSPGGQSLTGAAIIDGTTKIRADVSNLPPQMSIDINPAAQTADYHASSTIDQLSAGYVDTAAGPSLLARLLDIPADVHAEWTLGAAPHVRYVASSSLTRAELFAGQQGVETVDPLGNDYLSAAVDDLPEIVDVKLDFDAKHIEGDSSDAVGRIAAAARGPVLGREWTATGVLESVPAKFTVDFADGNYGFKAISGPLGKAAVTVSNHGEPAEPTSPAHLALHYDEVSGDIDASASIINLSEVGYTRAAAGQHLTLKADLGDNPLQLDANVLLKAGDVADTQLRAFGAITGLPSDIDIALTDGKITYTADKHVGIELGIRVGKVAALAGLGAPLPANGIAAVARSCPAGSTGCAPDGTPFCLSVSKCVGAVANINLAGLPTTVTVDSNNGTVSFTDYQPSASQLLLYVRLIGLIDAVPDVSARAALSGLPSSLDFTAGPFDFGTGDPASFDAGYQASAPLGTLSVDVNATTTNPTFPLLRANATVADLPGKFHLTGSLGGVSHVTVDDSAPIDTIAVKVTNATSGYLDAQLTDVPATMDYVINGPGGHAEATMSGPIGDISVLAHIPYDGRTWSALADINNVPGHFTADFGNGSFGFHALSGPLGSATFAVSNHPSATVPAMSRYLAAHYDQLSGNIDAAARVIGLTTVSYGKNASGDQTFDLDMGAATVGLDADAVFTANGARDSRFSVGGSITTPNTVHVDLSNSHIVYKSDQSAALRLSAAVGKVAALAGLGAPLYSQGVAVRARGCGTGPGCAHDAGVFCSVFSSCFGAVANVVLPGLPSKVDIDTQAGTVDVQGLHPSGDLKIFAELDGLVAALPQVRALATVSGLPATLNLKVGPFGADPADPMTFRAGYVANAPLGNLVLDADAQTTTSLGAVRGRFVANGLPATFSVTGKFGAQSHIHVGNSGPIDDLRVQATAALLGSPASGLIDFTDVPATMDMDIGAADTADGVNAPQFTYDSPASTLDGLAQVDAQLSQHAGPASVGTDGAFFRFTNLGGHTTVALDPSNYHLTLASIPDTDSIQLGLNIQVGNVPNQDFSEQVFDFLATQGYVEGHYGLRPSHIGDIELGITNLRSLLLQPGTAPFGLPALVGILFPGVTGDYGTFSMNMFDVDINPDVSVRFRVNDPIGDNHTLAEYTLPSHIDSFVFHRYDMNGPANIVTVSFIGLVCFNVTQNPRPTGKFANGVTLSGSNGPQTFNFIDFNDDIPDLLVNVISAYMSPFGHAFDYNVDGC